MDKIYPTLMIWYTFFFDDLQWGLIIRGECLDISPVVPARMPP